MKKVLSEALQKGQDVLVCESHCLLLSLTPSHTTPQPLRTFTHVNLHTSHISHIYISHTSTFTHLHTPSHTFTHLHTPHPSHTFTHLHTLHTSHTPHTPHTPHMAQHKLKYTPLTITFWLLTLGMLENLHRSS